MSKRSSLTLWAPSWIGAAVLLMLCHRVSHDDRSKLAIARREAFFQDMHPRFEQKLSPEDTDVMHARLLDELAAGADWSDFNLTKEEEQTAVQAWHKMDAWPDVREGQERLRGKCEVLLLPMVSPIKHCYQQANLTSHLGTTRLQLDLTKSSKLHFDMLFSSQLLGLTKPDLDFYRRAMHLVGSTPEKSIMVAAHAYDLRAGKQAGVRTIYMRRWTEDTEEDMAKAKADVDVFLGDLEGRDGQLGGVVEVLEHRRYH